MSEEKIVATINNLVLQAYRHGADPGGGYNCNEELCRKALLDAADHFGLVGYSVGEIWVQCDDGEYPGMWPTLQLIKV